LIVAVGAFIMLSTVANYGNLRDEAIEEHGMQLFLCVVGV